MVGEGLNSFRDIFFYFGAIGFETICRFVERSLKVLMVLEV